MKKLLSLSVLALFLASCASIQTDVHIATGAGASSAELESMELELVRFRIDGNNTQSDSSIQENRQKLAALSKAPGTDHVYRARLLALEAEAAFLAGDRKTANSRLEESLRMYAGDEIAIVLKSRMAKNNDEARAVLEEGLKKADSVYRIKAELASILYWSGDYRDAVSAFDASLPFLPEEYRLLYAEERNRAWALRDAESLPDKSSQRYLDSTELSFAGMITLTLSEGGAMDWFTGGKSWDSGVLFERLKAAGWFADNYAPITTLSTRKDAALFLWSLMARADSKMKTQYSQRYAVRQTSPIPDLEYGSPYFDSVLGTVEEGIMELVDGRNFWPDSMISGLDFWRWLRAAIAWR